MVVFLIGVFGSGLCFVGVIFDVINIIIGGLLIFLVVVVSVFVWV